MTVAQLKAAIKAASDGVSNDSTIDPAVARQNKSNAIGTAIDAFVTSQLNDVGDVNAVKESLISVIKHLKSLRVVDGNNLDQAVLDSLISEVQNI